MADYPTPSTVLRAYGRSAQLAMTPAQASVSLHERLCQELVEAKAAYQVGRLDRMCRHNDRCMRFFLLMRNDLLQRSPGSASAVLAGFYLHLHQRIFKLLSRADVVAEFDELITLLQSFCTRMRTPNMPSQGQTG